MRNASSSAPVDQQRIGKYRLLQALGQPLSSPTHLKFVVDAVDDDGKGNTSAAAATDLALLRIYDIDWLRKNHAARIGIERRVLVQRRAEPCPHIIHVKDCFATSTGDLCIVEEYCEGGELFELLESYNREQQQQLSSSSSSNMRRAAAAAADGSNSLSSASQTVVGLPLKIVRRLVSEILLALDFLHRTLRVCHRDIKLEHIFLDGSNKIRIGGFGMAVPVTDSLLHDPDARSSSSNSGGGGDAVLLTVMCGSKHYAAPEIVQSVPYDGCSADMWSLGVCVYTLLTGTFPFDGSVPPPVPLSTASPAEDALNIVLGKDNPRFAGIESAAARDFVQKLLCREPQLRMTARQALRHPFVAPPPPATSASSKSATTKLRH